MSNGDGSKQKENGPAENKEAHKHVGGNTPTDVPTSAQGLPIDELEHIPKTPKANNYYDASSWKPYQHPTTATPDPNKQQDDIPDKVHSCEKDASPPHRKPRS